MLKTYKVLKVGAYGYESIAGIVTAESEVAAVGFYVKTQISKNGNYLAIPNDFFGSSRYIAVNVEGEVIGENIYVKTWQEKIYARIEAMVQSRSYILNTEFQVVGKPSRKFKEFTSFTDDELIEVFERITRLYYSQR